MIKWTWQNLIRPAAFAIDAEQAHKIGVAMLRLGGPRYASQICGLGPVRRFGLEFSNPLGVAAGFDKNAVVINPLADLGFGCVEVGTVTLSPQAGKPRPRLFRLPKDRALINRMGFNNDGAAVIAERLKRLDRRCVVGVNIGRNKDVPNADAIANYVGAFELLQPEADYVVVNVSSPNTPELRELQAAARLADLLNALQEANDRLGSKPLLVKIAPDLNTDEIAEIAEVSVGAGLAGIIATNTTTRRDGLATGNVDSYGDGGLSGRPIRDRATDIVACLSRLTKGKLTIIGVGGIFDAADAIDKLRAGASLVQAYTGFVYNGPTFARDVVNGIAESAIAAGYSTFDEIMPCSPPDAV